MEPTDNDIILDKCMCEIKFKNVVWKEDKFYVAQCLNVDISSFGKTKKEALANLNEAVKLYFEIDRKRKA